MQIYISNSIEDTFQVGRDIASKFKLGDIIFLYGDLGAGKTTITKALAKALGIDQMITSPTFTLLNIYEFNTGKLCHFDLYRLDSVDELAMLGFEEYFYANDTICIIEWPQIVESMINKNIKTIKIEKISENTRRIIIGEKNENFIN